jgi:type IV secretion system protein VirB6
VLRLGFVLALVTGWPAFQTLVYDTSTRAPEELAATILPTIGLSPGEGLPARVQQVYDAMRLGANGDPHASDPQSAAQPGASATPQANGATTPSVVPGNSGQPGLGALPQTASIFAVATVGTISALHLAIGILLAVAPLAILALLFDGTLGLFNGWLRALVGTALASLAATIVTAVALIPIEQEVVRLQGWRGGGVLAVVDPQALPTLVLATGLAMLVATLAAVRMGGALRYAPGLSERSAASSSRTSRMASSVATMSTTSALTQKTAIPGRDRATGVAEALAMSVRREQRTGKSMAMTATAGRGGMPTGGRGDQGSAMVTGPASAVRRTSLRRSRSTTNRDRVGR